VGGALGKLASLKQELEETRRLYAWQRRIVSKGMIMDMNLNDDIVDQYEFVISSLFSLGKISSEDVAPIMDRFRGEKKKQVTPMRRIFSNSQVLFHRSFTALAGEKGYIQISGQPDEDEFEMKEDADGIKLNLSIRPQESTE
jgi:vesicle coat complex subunit